MEASYTQRISAQAYRQLLLILLQFMSVLFGCIMELILAWGLVERCFKHGTKRFNRAKKNVISDDTSSYERHVGYTGLSFSLKPSR